MATIFNSHPSKGRLLFNGDVHLRAAFKYKSIVIPSMCSVCKDTVVIPSTCIRERDIVIAPLVRVCVCVSVCLHLIAS